MNRIFCSLLLFCATSLVAIQSASAVTIDWSPVGNPGNANDPADGDDSTPGIQNFGAVAYNYNIGKYDVTNSQYVEFLNAKDATGADPLGLYNSNMSSAPYGGINFSNLNLPGNKYSVISGDGNHPVNFVTWFNASRFANWLNNGQGNGDTESGAYTLLHDGSPTPTPIPSNGDTITRNAGATIFLPNENEWYKAAYYDPRTTLQGGPPLDSHYWLYPTSSNTIPTESSPTALLNHANFSPGGPGNLTDVGAYTGTTSPSGAFDMGGNVWQWNEAVTIYFNGSTRGFRGGPFDNYSWSLLSSTRYAGFPSVGDYNDIGFRVASTPTPEPSTGLLAALGFAGLAAWGCRRNRWTVTDVPARCRIKPTGPVEKVWGFLIGLGYTGISIGGTSSG